MIDPEQHLAVHFANLQLPPDAARWLLDVWNAIQVLDDVADGDSVDREALDRAVYDLLVGMPSNRFFAVHASTLLPALGLMVLKWKASDTAERAGRADARSFVWLAGLGFTWWRGSVSFWNLGPCSLLGLASLAFCTAIKICLCFYPKLR